jgi:hypothetical protein
MQNLPGKNKEGLLNQYGNTFSFEYSEKKSKLIRGGAIIEIL